MVYPHIRYLGPAHPDRFKAERWTTRELDSRTSDGIHVRLLWHQSDGHISVEVNDTKSGETYGLRVHDGERALDVFHHPYAYAASRRHGASEPSDIASDSVLPAAGRDRSVHHSHASVSSSNPSGAAAKRAV